MIKSFVENGVARLVLNNPPLNILTRDLLAAIRKELSNLESEPTVRVLLLSAEGKHFSAGADVDEHMPPVYEQLIPEFMDTIVQLDAFPLPIVAAVQGRCLGGGFELVQPADMIVAAESASFGQPEITLGVFPPAACVMLPQLVSPCVAAEWVLTGETIGARKAEHCGMVLRVVPEADLERAVMNLASHIAQQSAAALRLAKRALKASRPDNRADALRLAGQLYVEDLMKTEDALEGLHAFRERRRPAWTHR